MKYYNRPVILTEIVQELNSIPEMTDSYHYKIYGIIDPINNELFYIGCTKVNISERIMCHYREYSCSKKPRENKHEKLQEMIINGIKPKIKIFYLIKEKNLARNIEKYLIHFLINEKYSINLLNKINSINVNPLIDE
jgi:hypothetical protein